MVRSIITLNSTNYVSGNQYSLRFPKTCSFDKDSTLSLYSFSMYNSMYNISASQYNNSQISFTWFDNTTYNWIIPDGYYGVADLNLWLQSQFIINKLYCTNSNNSQNVYFVVFRTNSVLYKNEIDTYYVPSATNAASFNYVKPSGATWSFPAANTCISITINSNLKSYFGMKTQLTFGPKVPVQNMQYLSDTCPIVSPVFSLFISCNLICSDYSQVGNIFTQIPINASYGQLVSYNSTMDSKINVHPGLYNSINIGLWDQNNNPLTFVDNELTIMLIIDQP